MTKEISQPDRESSIEPSAEGSIELSETELNQVTGGDKAKAPAPAPTKTEFLKVELKEVFVTSYSPT